MSYYLIEVDGTSDQYLVKANNKKEAKEIMWNNWFKDKYEEDKADGYEPVYKKDILVNNLKDFNELNEYGFMLL